MKRRGAGEQGSRGEGLRLPRPLGEGRGEGWGGTLLSGVRILRCGRHAWGRRRSPQPLRKPRQPHQHPHRHQEQPQPPRLRPHRGRQIQQQDDRPPAQCQGVQAGRWSSVIGRHSTAEQRPDRADKRHDTHEHSQIVQIEQEPHRIVEPVLAVDGLPDAPHGQAVNAQQPQPAPEQQHYPGHRAPGSHHPPQPPVAPAKRCDGRRPGHQ